MEGTIQTQSKLNLHPDVKAKVDSKKWFYTDTVKEHFFSPKNIFISDAEAEEYAKHADGIGMVGSPACITGETLIAVADGRKYLPIKQLVEESKDVPVYCYGENKIQIKMARLFRKTRTNTIVWKVTLNDSSSFKATPDHNLMLSDGSYKMINELKAGDQLIPFNNNLINYENGEVQLIRNPTICIKEIEFYGYEDVYNTTIDDFHNYVIITDKNNLSGIVIKNCGDSMKMWIKVDCNEDKIKELKWQTFGCLKEGELITSNPDFVQIQDVKIGDKIFNHLGEEAYVAETSKRKIDGFLYKITPLVSRFNTLSLTNNHPILAIRRKDLKFSQLKNTKYLGVKNKVLINAKPEFFLAESLSPGDYLIYQAPIKIKDNEELNERELKLLGFYLSEGYFTAKEKSSGQYGIVAFAFNKNETVYIEELKTLLKSKFGKEAKYRIRDNVCEIYLCSRIAIRFFDKYCGHMAKQKKLHPDLIYLPSPKQSILMDYYFKGDGHLYRDKRGNRQNQYIMTTASEKLALQLQQVIARLGFFATISKRKTVPSKIGERLITSKDSYVITYIIDKKKKSFAKKVNSSFLVPIKSIEKENYNGYVYNFEVGGENKSYLIKGFAVHNCASAIASTSMLSSMVTENSGMKIDDALKLKPQDIMARLGGLPNRKFHCSVLGDKALRSAINDYFRRSGQTQRIIVEGARIIDHETKTTDKDIEEAVLDGALTIDDVQKKLKVGIGNKAVIPAVEELIRFYKEKYFG